MADQFQIIPYKVRSAGTDVPPEEVQAAVNSLALQTTIALNSVASDPTGPAGGDLGGTYPNPTVTGSHIASGTINGASVGATTPGTGAFTTLTATTPVGVTSGGTGLNALTAHAVVIGEGSSAPNFAGPGTTGQMLLGVTGADPAFGNNPTITGGSINSTPVGATTPSTGAFTSLSASSGLNSTAVGNTTPSTGAFTTLSASSGLNSTAVGNTTPSTGAFTTLSASSGLNSTAVGNTTPGTGAFTTLSSTGTFTPSQTNGIVGTTTNNNANAGSVGEFISSTVLIGSAVALTSGVAANITSISLTAGDWDVWGNGFTNPGGTTTTQSFGMGVSTTSASFPTAPNGGAYQTLPISTSAGQIMGLSAGYTRLSLASTTTVYLVVQSFFSISTLSAYGFIGARRVR